MSGLEKSAVDRTLIKHVNVIGLLKMKEVWGCDMEGRDVQTGPGVEKNGKCNR